MAKRRPYDWGDADDDETAHDEADFERFSSDVAFCPECGAEIYDAADICPKCFTWIDGNTTHRKPSAVRRSMRALVVLVLIALILGGAAAVLALRR